MAEVDPGTETFRRRARSTCNPDFRTLDGTCTNSLLPGRKLWGSSNRPQFSYFGNKDTSEVIGQDLPSPRMISNIVSTQTTNAFDERRLSEIATFVGQFIDHTLVASPINFDDPFDIELPEGETVGRFSGSLPFFRSQRVIVNPRSGVKRPQNSLSSVVDMNNVYGPSEMRNERLRTLSGGKMKTSAGNLLPLNGGGEPFFNAPNLDADFFLGGDHRSNEHPILTTLHTIFLREHNLIADELPAIFPNLAGDDQALFDLAKKINEAQWQKIVFEEWFPALTGRQLPKYTGFNRNVETTVSVTFSTAAFRVGHTLVGNMINLRGPGNSRMPPKPFSSSFFRSASTIREVGGIDPILRGAIVNRAQKVDTMVVDALRNFLFTGIEGEDDNLDLIALNLQRGRDHGVPSYNEICARFRGSRATSFGDISSSRDVRRRLREAYGNVNRIEAWPGLMAEDHAPRSSLGPTLLAILMTEFTRLRDGDSFFFRNNGVIPASMRNAVPRLRAVFAGEDIFRAIILRNTGITEDELPERLFFV